MARARLIKPGFFTNDDLAELPMAGRLLFAGLWTLADRAGRMEDRPRRIKAEILPYDDVDIDALLAQLASTGFILRYEAGGNRYLQVTNFGKHQSPHVREPDSIIPAPDEHGASMVQAPDEHEDSPASRAHSPIPHSLNHNHNHNPIPEAETRALRGADAPPVPDVPVVASMNEVTDDRPYGMVAMLCAENGKEIGAMPADWRNMQLAIAKRLLANHSIESVRRYVRYRRTEWNGATPFDLRHVEKDIGPWELAGGPARASPNEKNGRNGTNGRAAHIDAPAETVVTGRLAGEGAKRVAAAARAATHSD